MSIFAEAGGGGEFVFGDAVGVEAAGERAGVVDDGADTAAAELGGAGERGGTTADERDGAAGVGCGREWKPGSGFGERVHGEALQAADSDGLLVIAVRRTQAPSQSTSLSRAGAGAAFAEDIGVENSARGALEVVGGDLLDEARDVDVRWAGGGARSVETVEAAIGFRDGGGLIEGRMKVRETRSNLR